jgi:uncharacterized membrane protein
MTSPVEYLVIEFPGNKFNGDVAPAVAELIETGIVRLLDLLFVTKDEAGVVAWFELGDFDAEVAQAFDALEGTIGGLVSDEDVAEVAEGLPDNCSAAILVWENVWAERFVEAVRASQGEVLAHERIPADVVDAALATIEA